MEAGAWEALRAINEMPSITERRPSVGRIVRVISGKRLGVEGTVTWHGRDQFTRAYRYADSMQAHMRDLMQQSGFRVRIRPHDGGEQFFIAAEKVCVL